MLIYKNFKLFLITSMLSTGFVMEVVAEPIRIGLTAEVSRIDDFDGHLTGIVNVGDIITGYYIYESTTPDTSSSTTIGIYNHTAIPFGINLNIGGFLFRTDPSDVDFSVDIVNNHGATPVDNYLLSSYNNVFDISVGDFEHISWQLDDATAMAINAITLPTVPPVLADWQSIFGLSITSDDHSSSLSRFSIQAHVTSVYIIPDTDGDSIYDHVDNCPLDYNPDQADRNGNGVGDICDSGGGSSRQEDSDGDGITDRKDNCPNIFNPDQSDLDGDGIGDACDTPPSDTDSDFDGINDDLDNCPLKYNPDQLDSDADGIGNVCDKDIDGDGIPNKRDKCPDTQNGTTVDKKGCPV